MNWLKIVFWLIVLGVGYLFLPWITAYWLLIVLLAAAYFVGRIWMNVLNSQSKSEKAGY